MNKKTYQTPRVTRVKLQVKDAVLASCRLSGGGGKDGADDCHAGEVLGCYN